MTYWEYTSTGLSCLLTRPAPSAVMPEWMAQTLHQFTGLYEYLTMSSVVKGRLGLIGFDAVPPDRQLHQVKVHEVHQAKCSLLYTLVVSLSFEHHASDSTILLGFTPIFKENTLGVVTGLPTLLPFHQRHEKTCGSMVI
ncbi:hypothetical protein TNCV_880131 [Trichonephila clavipes]|nr:hypothetical protein TNCV_880131 [Trichonephila clavipes]